MKTVRTFIMTLLALIVCSLHATAQTEFYYYGTRKTPLYLNENKVVLTIPKTSEAVSERIRANVQVLVSFNDSVLDILVIPRSDYEKLTTMDCWEEDAKSVIKTSCFYLSENKKKEVYESPYLAIKLKEEDDIDLLNSYVERYKLRIAMYSSLMPLWYTLCVTLDSGKGSLQCANELYESGYFAAATPDMLETDYSDETQVQGITTKKQGNASGIFDLQGRPVLGTSKHGIYVKDGRKVIR